MHQFLSDLTEAELLEHTLTRAQHEWIPAVVMDCGLEDLYPLEQLPLVPGWYYCWSIDPDSLQAKLIGIPLTRDGIDELNGARLKHLMSKHRFSAIESAAVLKHHGENIFDTDLMDHVYSTMANNLELSIEILSISHDVHSQFNVSK